MTRPRGVHEGTTAVAGIDRGVGLQGADVRHLALAASSCGHGPVLRTDDPGRRRSRPAPAASRWPRPGRRRRPRRRCPARPPSGIARIDLENGQVIFRRAPSRSAPRRSPRHPGRQRDPSVLAGLDDVIIGQHVAVLADHEAGSGAALAAGAYLDVRDAGDDPVAIPSRPTPGARSTSPVVGTLSSPALSSASRCSDSRSASAHPGTPPTPPASSPVAAATATRARTVGRRRTSGRCAGGVFHGSAGSWSARRPAPRRAAAVGTGHRSQHTSPSESIAATHSITRRG